MDSHQETLIYHDKNHLNTIIYYKYYYELLYIYIIIHTYITYTHNYIHTYVFICMYVCTDVSYILYSMYTMHICMYVLVMCDIGDMTTCRNRCIGDMICIVALSIIQNNFVRHI